MAGKRQATSELNHDNWNQEDEPEERGTFKTASQEEINQRVIKKARRKLGTESSDAADGNSGTKSVFSNFSGFGQAAPAASSAATAFSFLSKIPAASAPVSSGAATNTSPAAFTFNTTAVSSAASTTEATKSIFGGSTATNFSFGGTSTTATKENSSIANKKYDEYYAKLRGLNQDVSAWIKTHVDKNPFCILTPIMEDYYKYLKVLEEEKEQSDSSLTTEKKTSAIETFKFSEANTKVPASTSTASTLSFSTSTAPSSTNNFSFGLKKPGETKTVATTTSTSASFSFGLKSSPPGSSTSFGIPNTSAQEGSKTQPFSFTSGGTPFSFGNIKPPEAIAPKEDDEEDEKPPVNVFKQVVEEDAVYSKKCKVFVKKDGNFVDKGVGTLYLKPIESNGKTQLLVRADTNLGNILVNIILSSGIPSQRMGKNNVMLVCLPTPDVDKPTPMLLRVKTGEEADDLLKNIEKYKKLEDD